MNFKPAHNRIILTLVEKPCTQSSIIIPEDRNPWSYALVKAVGPDVTRAKVGDIILFYKCDGTQIEVDNVTYIHIREDHLVGTYIKENKND